jgi:hypothetical protein
MKAITSRIVLCLRAAALTLTVLAAVFAGLATRASAILIVGAE